MVVDVLSQSIYLIQYRCNAMRTVQIRKDIKDRLDEVKGSQSTNSFFSELLADVVIVDELPKREKVQYANIHISDDVLQKLKSCKLSESESYSDVVSRLLDSL